MFLGLHERHCGYRTFFSFLTIHKRNCGYRTYFSFLTQHRKWKEVKSFSITIRKLSVAIFSNRQHFLIFPLISSDFSTFTSVPILFLLLNSRKLQRHLAFREIQQHEIRFSRNFAEPAKYLRTFNKLIRGPLGSKNWERYFIMLSITGSNYLPAPQLFEPEPIKCVTITLIFARNVISNPRGNLLF